MRIALKSLAALFLVLPASAQATCGINACNDEYITHLRVEVDNRVLVRTSGDESSLNCTLVAGEYIVLDMSDSNAEAAFSMLLTAQSQNKPVSRIRIVEGSSDCKILYIYQD